MSVVLLLRAALVGLALWEQGPPASFVVAAQKPQVTKQGAENRTGRHSPDCTVPFFQGLDHFRNKQLDAAIIDFSSAAACNPSFVEAKIALGDALVVKGDDRRALEAYQSAMKLRPGDEDALRPAASICLRLESNTQAIPLFETLVRLHPDDIKAKTDLGIAYAATGQFAKAEQQLTEVHRKAPQDPAGLVALGALDLKTGGARAAIPLLLDAVRAVPDEYKPHFLLGSAYNRVGEYENATKELGLAAKLDPNNFEVQYQLAQAYGHIGNREQQQQAMARFNALRERSKEDPTARAKGPSPLTDAEALAEQGEFEDAIELARKALSLEPENDRIIFLVASLYYDAGQFDAASEYAKRAVAKAPSEWKYHYLFGLTQEVSGQTGPATDSFKIAVRLNPRCSECYDRMGELAMRINDPELAVKNFRRAVQLEPTKVEYKDHLQAARRAAAHKP